MWTEKYKPRRCEDMVGQKKAILETTIFLDNWKPGRGLMFHGSPGVGKTLLAEIVAKERDWALVQINASDSRSGKELEALLGQSSLQKTLFHKGKIILIDEADGISGRERGAETGIINVLKKSKFPIIIVANDPWHPKLRNLRGYCEMVKFNSIPYPSIAKRLHDIAEKEGVKAEGETLKNLARWASGDIRSAILDLQLLLAGKDSVTEKDLESLGFRERQRAMFDILPTIFFSGSINASRKVIREVDKDPDEVFWWLESNLVKVYKSADSLASGYDLLSKADLFRSIVLKQQNWRFKAYMIDMMSGISLFKDERHGFVPFRPPDRFLMLGRTKHKRAMTKSLCRKLGEHLHCPARVAKMEYIPLMKLMLKKGTGIADGFDLSAEEIEAIRKY